MTQQETAQVLTLLRAAYPAFYRKTTAQEAEIAVRLWAEMFAEDDYSIVQYALKQLIADHSGYPPDIAALKTKIKEVIQAATGAPTHEDLWQLLKSASQNSRYGYEEEYAKLPPVLQRFLGLPYALHDLADMDVQTLNTVYHGQFLKQIPTIEARMAYEASLPAPVKAAISAAAATKRMPEPRRQLTEREVNDRRNKILNTLPE